MQLLSFFLLLLPLVTLADQDSTHIQHHPRAKNLHRSASTKKSVKYVLEDKFRGQDFIDKWNFFDQADLTHGKVAYQSKQNAKKKKLAFVQNDGTAVLRVDNTTTLGQGQNRASVRISSPKTYSGGLFIADFFAMPTGCSTWPAYWSVGPNWPHKGEIDVLEGVNTNTKNSMTLHTSDGCSLTQDVSSQISGKLGNHPSCASSASDNTGCGIQDTDTKSYGKGFNKQGGGVYAHLWNDDGISIWFFTRSAIPKDIQNGKPNPDGWGKPRAMWKKSSCNIKSHFRDHSLVINTSLCGDWAGDQNQFKANGCPGTCADMIKNPANFDTAFWKINYVSVFQPGS